LFDKTGTGKDLENIKERNRLVRDRIVALRKLRDEALQRGEVVDDHDHGWLKSLGLSPWHPVMIVVPTSIVVSWKKSFDLFTHFSVETYASETKEGNINSMKYGRCDVLIVPKSLFASEVHFLMLNQLEWKLIIIDEFHNYKGQHTHISDHLRNLKDQHGPLVVGLTGTLMQNNHKELWNLCDLVETNYLGSWEDFKRNVDRAISLGRYVNNPLVSMVW
jgi:SNF2 family DNA or RNA helicase